MGFEIWLLWSSVYVLWLMIQLVMSYRYWVTLWTSYMEKYVFFLIPPTSLENMFNLSNAKQFSKLAKDSSFPLQHSNMHSNSLWSKFASHIPHCSVLHQHSALPLFLLAICNAVKSPFTAKSKSWTFFREASVKERLSVLYAQARLIPGLTWVSWYLTTP